MAEDLTYYAFVPHAEIKEWEAKGWRVCGHGQGVLRWRDHAVRQLGRAAGLRR